MTADWVEIGKQLVAVGAPTIGAAVGGPLGAQIGGVLASILGAEATPGAVGDAIAANPDVVKQAEAAPSADLSTWLNAHAQTAALLASTETARENAFAWAWRPALSWLLIFMWLWNAVALPVANAALAAGIASIPWEQLVGFSGLWLAIYGGGHTVKSIWGK